MTHRAEYMSMVKAKEVRKKMPGFSTASKNEVDPSPNQRINSTKMNVLMWKFPRSNRERKDYNPQEKKIW